MKQHYKALGLEEGASQQEIEAAFKRLSKVLDPANNDNQEFFIEEYKKVQEAYNALYNTSILGTEKGVNSFKKTQPKSNDKEPSIPESTVKPKANKIPLKENKLPKKGYSIIKWFLVLLGSIISGGLFAFLISVYYFKDATIDVFVDNILNIRMINSFVAKHIVSNFLIGFFTFIFLFVLIKKYLKFNFKKSKTKKIKSPTPKKRISKRDFVFGFLLFFIAIGIWILILQNMGVFV